MHAPATIVRHVHLIGGLPRHGKSTAASLLAKYTGEKWSDCSSIIFVKVAEEERVSVEVLKTWDKAELRPKLIAMGDKLCQDNPCYLAQYLIDQGVSIVAGVRKPDEIEALRRDNPSIQFTMLWIEALPFSGADHMRAIAGPEEEFYFAPDIADNTNPAIRALADEIVYNLDLSHLNATIQYLATKSHLCQTPPPLNPTHH